MLTKYFPNCLQMEVMASILILARTISRHLKVPTPPTLDTILRAVEGKRALLLFMGIQHGKLLDAHRLAALPGRLLK